jgi:RNA polymerase sigma-70 factor (ECF subfamily)
MGEGGENTMDERARGATNWLESAMPRYANTLARTAYAYLGDLALAEDAVQETFLKAWKGFDRFRGEADEKTWLLRIAINTCKDLRRGAWFRRVDRSVPLESLPEGEAPFTPADDALTRAVMALPHRQRAVVLLHCYQELTAEETARVLGVARSTVFARLQKARKALQQALEGYEDEDDR